MLSTHKKAKFAVIIFFIYLYAPILPVFAGNSYDGYYNYIGTWPVEKDTVYAEDVQGIAHSDNSWFITKSGDSEGSVLYKIAVTEDLSNPQISKSVTPISSGLSQKGYTEYKGMDSRRNPTNGIWYLLIGVQGRSGAGIAFYDENLSFKGVAHLSKQSAAGWCAIDNSGKIYSAVNNTDYLNCYELNWSSLASDIVPAVFAPSKKILLKDSHGNSLTMVEYQGGDFTPEGDKLFIVTGFFDISTSPHGIHVFDVSTSSSSFKRIRKSEQSGLFQYSYDPSPLDYEEPEGLTFWDLTDGRAPHIDGELHVLLLDNDADFPVPIPFPPFFTIVDDDDDVYIKHYTKGVYVDHTFSGTSNGDPTKPDKTISAAVNRAYDDMEIRIKSGIYPESLSISKHLHMAHYSGAGRVTIGN